MASSYVDGRGRVMAVDIARDLAMLNLHNNKQTDEPSVPIMLDPAYDPLAEQDDVIKRDSKFLDEEAVQSKPAPQAPFSKAPLEVVLPSRAAKKSKIAVFFSNAKKDFLKTSSSFRPRY